MKPLIITNHSLDQYSSRTGRNKFTCVAELINNIRTSTSVSFEMAKISGFNITRGYKGDTYHVWYDPKVDDSLCAIIAYDGAVKTVLRKEMLNFPAASGKKERFNMKGRTFRYGRQQKHSRRM